jgi:hypothetical protein
MEPQQENKQNNSNEPIRIIPTRGGVVSPTQNSSTGNFFHLDNERNNSAVVGLGSNNTPPVFSTIKPQTSIESAGTKPEMVIEPEKNTFSPSVETVKISPIHTYADDVKNIVQSDGVSMAKIMMAEVKKQEAEKAREIEISPTSDKNKGIIAISITALVVAIVGFAGVLYFVGNKDSMSVSFTQQPRPSIIPYDEEFVVNLEIKERKKILENIENSKKQKFQKETSIVYVPMYYKNSTTSLMMNTEVFLSTLDVRAPSALLRAFGNGFMFGLNNNAGQVNSFMLLYSDSFNQMYAGMLEWEPSIADDIGDLFFVKDDLIEVSLPKVSATTSTTTKISLALSTTTSTSTSTSTSASTYSTTTPASNHILNEIEYKAFKSRYIIANSLKFNDEVLNNMDLRVLRTTSGKILMYYTFINDKILLIAKDFKTLDEVVKRLATSQFKQ